MPELGVLRPPPSVLFGAGTIAVLGEVAAAHGERIVVCTDSYLASAEQGTRALTSLKEAGLDVEVLDAAVPELPRASVEEAIAAARRLEPDCIVALGGGSSLDLGKLVALGLSHEVPLPELYGENRVPGPTLPVVAVPTTAGTGSEVTPVAVLSDPEIEMKVGISSTQMIPRAAICDPQLTHGAPAAVSAFAGIDALAHAIEAYTAILREDPAETTRRIFVGANALSDPLALRAIELLAGALRGAVEDDPTARADALAGSLFAGLAFATAGTAAAHAFQYPIGARTKTPHGLGVGLLLPFAMRFNLPAREERMGRVARALGADSADQAPGLVRELGIELGVPASLAEIGIEESELPALAEQGLTIARLIDNNPRSISPREATALLSAAWSGELDRADVVPEDGR